MSQDQLEQLIKDFYRSVDKWPNKAAAALRQRGEPGKEISVEAFIDIMLNDPTPLRKAAIQILREWREYVPLDPLFLALQDVDEQIQPFIKWAIAEVGSYAPEESLLPHLANADATVRASVLYALGKRAPLAAVLEAICAPEEDLREVGVFLVGVLGEQMPIEPLVNMLKSDDARIRVAALSALGNLRERIPLEPLVEALQDADVNVRLQAINALSDTGERMPRVALHALFDDADQELRLAAAKALVRVGDPAALAVIVGSLHADHEWKRETALVKLTSSIDVERREIARHLPIEELLHLLTDEWYPVGHLSAALIAELAESAPFTDLLALVSHPLPQARWAALRTLALLGEYISLGQYISMEPIVTALDTDDDETHRFAATVLDCFGPLAPVDKLLPLVADDDTRVAYVLAKRGYQEGIDALAACLRSRHYAWNAAVALGELGERAPLEPLLAALSASDLEVACAAAEALYKTHPEILPRLVPELLETLNTGNVGLLLDPLRQALLTQALARLQSTQPALLEWLAQALNSPNWEVRMWAAHGWSQLAPGVPDAPLEKLQHLLHDPASSAVRNVARGALDVLLPPESE